MIKEVVIISGKGGTGKTSITASFAVLAGKDIIVGDCDVDADDMHLLLKPDYQESSSFYSGYKAVISDDKCSSCGNCREICRFKAVNNENGVFSISGLNCEGCGYCAEICPAGAIEMVEAKVGSVFKSTIKTGAVMVHARLMPGADNSGKLVAKVKRDAKNAAEESGADMILIDGSPGIGCPVVSSLTGADYVILVTEPTPSGLHDLRRVYELVKRFGIEAGLIINKCDLNSALTARLTDYADSENIDMITRLPYNEDFTAAVTEGLTAAEYMEGEISTIVKNAWKTAKKYIKGSEI